MTSRLDIHTLAGVSPQIICSHYQRPLAAGVVHLGLGAFHRAHQAMVFDTLMQSGDLRWGVFGVAMRSTQLADALQQQNGLYSVQISSAADRSCQVVRSLLQTCVTEREPSQVTAAIANPSTRWVTVTVTEKGYTPALAGVILQGLERRRAKGLAGLTLASCDNLSANGDGLKALCLREASSPDLKDWISERCTFPNSMVDRIVPAASDRCLQEAQVMLGLADAGALATEAFWEWVIEDRFVDPEDAPALRAAGVSVVASVEPFEVAKLRMLNGSHSAIACIGAVLGLPTVADCMALPELRQFIDGLLTEEIMPGVERPDPAAYRDALLMRFSNPALNHSVHQIATDSSKKIPQRWVPAVLAQLERGGEVEHLAMAAAAWMLFCRGYDEAGKPFTINDPMASELQNMAYALPHDADTMFQSMPGSTAIWGYVLTTHPHWIERVGHWRGRAQRLGLTGAICELNNK